MADKVIKEVIELANKQVSMLRDIEAVQQTLDQMTKRYNTIKNDLLPGLMKEHELEEIKLSDGSVIELKEDVSVSISEANKPAAYKWLDKHEFGGIIKTQVLVSFDRSNEDRDKANKLVDWLEKRNLTTERKEGIHAGTLKAFVKAERAKGTKFPKSIPVFPYEYANVKLGKKES